MPQSPQEDLLHALDTTNTSGIYAVHFIPNRGSPFNVKTKRMKQISLYVTNKLQKTEFAPGELEHVYSYVKNYLPNELSLSQREQLDGLVKDFVYKGGKVEYTKYSKVILYGFLVAILFSIALFGFFSILLRELLSKIFSGGNWPDTQQYIDFGLCVLLIAAIYLNKKYLNLTKDIIKKNR